MKYFNNINSLDELKKEFRRLAMLHHPDRGGDTATMQAINPEFDGIEVYFPAKPSEETRSALKSAGYRWHGKKKCWYARNTEKNLQALRTIETGTYALGA